MDININQVRGGNVQLSQFGDEQVKTGEKQAPILGGESIVISEPGDFERLLSELQDEIEKRRIALAKTKLSAALAEITGIANGLSADQNAALVIIQLKTEALENIIKNMQVTTAERKKLIEQKQQLQEQKQAIQKKLDDLDKSIELEQVASDVAVEDAAKSDDEGNQVEKANDSKDAERAELEKQLAKVNAQIDSVTTQIAQCDKKIDDMKALQKDAMDAIATATAKLDKASLGVLFAATRITAQQVLALSDGLSKKEEEDDEELETIKSIDKVVSDQLDKLTEEMRDEITRKQTHMV